jgi:hypothetical protein
MIFTPASLKTLRTPRWDKSERKDYPAISIQQPSFFAALAALRELNYSDFNS